MNVMISSAGRRVGLMGCVRRALAELGVDGRVIAADASASAPAAHLADDFRIVPRCGEPGFIGEMLNLCRREHVGLLIPTIDTELGVYAAHWSEFESAGVCLAVSSPSTVELAADKRATNAWLREQGFPAVNQTSPQAAMKEGWRAPLIAKPARGSASVGLRRIETAAELETLPAAPEYVVEAIAEGDEYTVHAYVDREGRCRTVVPSRRLEVRAGEVSKGLTVKHRPMMDLVRRLVEALPGAYGPLNVQCFLSESGAMRVIEINARFGGGYPLVDQAGGRFARSLIEETLGRPITMAGDEWTDDLAMLRYDDAVFLSGESIRRRAQDRSAVVA